MSLNWTKVKSLAIPVGGVSRDVKRVTIGGAVVWEKPSPLPYDAEVEYLESTGTQWINLGIIPNEYTGVSLTAASTGNGGQYNRLFGTQVNGQGKTMTIRCSDANGGSFYMETGSSGVSVGAFDTDIHTFKFNIPLHSIVFDGTTKATPTTSSNITGTCWLWGTNGESRYHGKYRVYGLEFYDMQSGTLTAKYVPVRVGTVGYLYDRVTGKLFGNAGTGAFVVGQDVVPVEYIESHGTEYINTGLAVPFNADAHIGVSFNKRVTYDNFGFGCVNNGVYGVTAFITGANRVRVRWGGSNFLDLDQTFGDIITVDYLQTTSQFVVKNTATSASVTVMSDKNTIATPLVLFGNNNGGTITKSQGCKLFAFTIDEVCDYKPVRVGSASTWEGAMIDTLTRRIYRNAGTGAFTYGADLPYPMGG